jgi:tetratricopeptide (TPR) repeat protein
VLIISKDYQKAITYINKGLALTPNHDYLTFNKALTYYLMKDYKNADLRYSNLWKDYKPEEAKIIYADYLLSQSDYIGAANTVESVLTKYPDNALALASKVVIFDEMHRMGKTVPDSSFDYKTPSVVENAKNKL